MSAVFPKPITHLPRADIPLGGVDAYLSQSKDHQILFMQFAEDVELPEHAHESQWGIVLEGKIEIVIDEERRTYSKGDRYFIPAGVTHSSKVYAGYADVTFFNQPDRFKLRKDQPASP